MYNIIPLILILISLGVMSIITLRKFESLASLDVKNMPAEKEAMFKNKIISDRFKRSFLKWRSKFVRLLRPVGDLTGNFFKLIHDKLHELREKYKHESAHHEAAHFEGVGQKVEKLFQESEELKKKGELDLAEKKLIEIIGLDNKNIDAFKELGRIYFDAKNYENAKQTFEHVLKLKEDDEVYSGLAKIAKEKGDFEEAKGDYLKSLKIHSKSQTYFELALIYKAMENMDEAISALNSALDVSPNNPRYLDTLLEVSIIKKDKNLARNVYKMLAKANPENNKLEEFNRKIEELPAPV